MVLQTFTDEENTLTNECYLLILRLLEEAGKLIVSGFAEVNKRVDTKSGSWDLVTEYDKNVEKLLINGILSNFPEHKFVAEESCAEAVLTDSPTWVIDPIDGTNNFVHGIPFIAISVAFVLRKELAIGIIYNPLTNEMYKCRKGHGAYLNDQRIYCSKTETLDKALFGHESSFARMEQFRDKNIKRIIKFSTVSQGFRSFGCAALSLAYVAKGSVDAYHIDDLKPWDVAAGALLISEAGGVIYKSDGTEFDFMTPFLVCAGTEKLCQEIIAGIQDTKGWTLNITK